MKNHLHDIYLCHMYIFKNKLKYLNLIQLKTTAEFQIQLNNTLI